MAMLVRQGEPRMWTPEAVRIASVFASMLPEEWTVIGVAETDGLRLQMTLTQAIMLNWRAVQDPPTNFPDFFGKSAMASMRDGLIAALGRLANPFHA